MHQYTFAESKFPRSWEPPEIKLDRDLGSRSTLWEFWPVWAMYLPLIPWLICLAIRYRHPLTFAASNPGIPFGGLCGESKSEILAKLTGPAVLGWVLLHSASSAARLEMLVNWMEKARVAFPIILKPDVGERGRGVRVISTLQEAHDYFNTHSESAIAQEHAPGPHEAGVFYYRVSPTSPGTLFSITHKAFPAVVGDGTRTLKQLIEDHPRYRRQTGIFFARHAARLKEIPLVGEQIPLARAGNHCQGTQFCDGRHLASQELARALDRALEAFPGFCFGRFDIRYADPDELRKGNNFSIVEVNGVSSESTDIYDPRNTFLNAQRTLRAQWTLAFRIGAANRASGAVLPSFESLLSHLSWHLSHPVPETSSD